jgi:hypothetical protein
MIVWNDNKNVPNNDRRVLVTVFQGELEVFVTVGSYSVIHGWLIEGKKTKKDEKVTSWAEIPGTK